MDGEPQEPEGNEMPLEGGPVEQPLQRSPSHNALMNPEDPELQVVKATLSNLKATPLDASRASLIRERLVSLLQGKDSLEAMTLLVQVLHITKMPEPVLDNDTSTNGSARGNRQSRAVERMECPAWSGKPEELASWRLQVNNFFEINDITEDKVQMLALQHPRMVPAEFSFLVRGLRTVEAFWTALEEYVTPSAVRAAIARDLIHAKAIQVQSPDELRRVHRIISDFCKHVEDFDYKAEIQGVAAVELALDKLGHGFLREQFAVYERQVAPNQRTSLRTIRAFLQERIGFLNAKTAGSSLQKPTGERDQRPRYSHETKNRGETSKETETKPNQGAYKVGKATFPKGFFSPVMFVEARMRGSSSWHKCRVLIDEGCDLTFISPFTARNLGFPPVDKSEASPPVTLSLLSGQAHSTSIYPREVVLRPIGGRELFPVTASELPTMREWSRGVAISSLRAHHHLQNVDRDVPQDRGMLDFIIGFDYKALTTPMRYEPCHPSHARGVPVLAISSLGKVIIPPYDPAREKEEGRNEAVKALKAFMETDQTLSYAALRASVQEEDLTEVFRQWATQDWLGVAPTRVCACTPAEVEESAFIHHVRKTMTLTPEGRIQVKLPWKEGYPTAFANNRRQVQKAQQAIMRQVQASDQMSGYEAEMALVVDAYSEEVPEENKEDPNAWYLLHFPVENRTKLRVVWNSARPSAGHCLNDGLYKGPALLSNLSEVLFRFRVGCCAALGDIKKMFNQVEICESDRNFHRFFWNGQDRRWTRLVFGDKSSPDLAIAATRFLADLKATEMPLGAKAIKQNTYMDDVLIGCEDEKVRDETTSQVDAILQQGSFSIKKWTKFPMEQASKVEEKDTVLGTVWDLSSEEDSLAVRPIVPVSREPLNKRRILSCIASLWDPIGMAAPMTVEARISLQAMWDCQLGWDEALGPEDETEWRIRLEALQLISAKVPRAVVPNVRSIHVFSDAGRDAYGAVAWAENGEARSFLEAKMQVSPLKTQSIPRLELMAALLGSRIALRAAEVFGAETIVLWTDSITTQKWILTPSSKLKAFVAARVAEIHDIQGKIQLKVKRIPTEKNPADALTKPMIKNSEDLQTWIKGPEFLMKQEEWEFEEEDLRTSDEATVEFRCAYAQTSDEHPLDGLVERVSSWATMKRVVARMLTWNPQRRQIRGIIYLDNLREAEAILLKRCQEAFPPAVPMGLKPSLDAYGVTRLMGRLGYMEGSPKVSIPAALSSQALLSLRIAEELHLKNFHLGARQIIHLAHVDLGIFIVGGRGLAKKIVRDCVPCRLNHGRLVEQPMAPLPEERLESGGAAFENVALDYFETKGSRKKSKTGTKGVKILILVCQVTRAVHLERVKDFGVAAFADAWIRFSCKRGVWPKVVFADKAPTFKKAASELNQWDRAWEKAMNTSGAISDHRPQIKWVEAVPRAPHRMGTVEALVKSIKLSIKAGVRNLLEMDSDAWETLLARITFLINSRPLDPSYWTDLGQAPISANDLLFPYLHRRLVPDCPIFAKAGVSEAAHFFWTEWRSQVPPELLPRSKWDGKPKQWKINDLVLIKRLQRGGVQLPRGSWPKGVITEVHPSKDGVVRKVTLKLANGKNTVAATPYLTLLMREE